MCMVNNMNDEQIMNSQLNLHHKHNEHGEQSPTRIKYEMKHTEARCYRGVVPYPLPRYSSEEALFESRPTIPPRRRWGVGSPSPSATPVVGGWGKPISWCVYIVGIDRSPAGGAWEAVVLRVQVLKLAWIPFDDATPWSSAIMRVASRSSGIFGLLELFSPRPWPRVRLI
jgi:hypothetical protein